ncbi:MAG TPA: hypothetical protein VJ852_13630 [Gemmatimonadaceae bacterium]|nr:hypothetical protein [Gemmatimonadaceae bacterium]
MPARRASSAGAKVEAKASASHQIAAFLAKYDPKIAAAARGSRSRLRKMVPGGTEFVYDNYNALVFGYGPSDRPSEAVLSLAIMPRWVTLCFLKGAKLRDPKKLLRGSGNIVRNIHLSSPRHLEDREVRDLIDQSISAARPEFAGKPGKQQTVIKSISAKQRPRRPA